MRIAKALATVVLALITLVIGGDTLGGGDPVTQIARPHAFSLASWEVANLPRKWTHALGQIFGSSMDHDAEVSLVRQYFSMTRRINDERERFRRIVAGIDPGDRNASEARLDALRESRDRFEAQVERILEGMITDVLKDEGIWSRLLFQDFIWPPVDLRLATVPRVLIVSPRDEIRLLQTKLLSPDISQAQIEGLEETVDGRDLSSLVQGIAGVATYPALVPDTSSLRDLLRSAAHEWVHHYLFFHPLGRAYWESGPMTTINETVADIVGEEVGDEVYRRHFAGPGELRPEPTPTSPEAPGQDEAFDFGAAMRETRLMADKLLAEGKIEEAEAYMEARRLFMAEYGYVFRKLNQAFFAFNQAYASQPGSVDPIGDQLQQARTESPSLKVFLFRLAAIGSFEAYKVELRVEG